MKFWGIFTIGYIGLFAVLCLIFLKDLDQAANIYFYIMTIAFAASWIVAMKQDGVGEVSRQAVRKFNFHMKSKASQDYLKDDEILNPNMKELHLKERTIHNWVLPFVVLSTLFFIISIFLGFIV
ncbi:DUF3899 domain-containing protein [Mammaliicoccus sciuri]|uniref:DUF3899 domain-containing protein n=1 Tax=Mammaliicoccus sciuri TaxID=1296 RepID=UPI000E6928F3|nr:DUF3899 domain-containing protein [Mammaliicoccus sciuri]MCE5039604.1 DUF3899 domain-containing protein [Mammaliicoccus sciuri]MCE5057045.1 DUF3899 domain-containing protein [Mammaliicoccus sciuri]RIN95558.1 DUF3899 domain-containing protein [Mammaliicoccus sciuri]